MSKMTYVIKSQIGFYGSNLHVCFYIFYRFFAWRDDTLWVSVYSAHVNKRRKVRAEATAESLVRKNDLFFTNKEFDEMNGLVNKLVTKVLWAIGKNLFFYHINNTVKPSITYFCCRYLQFKVIWIAKLQKKLQKRLLKVE